MDRRIKKSLFDILSSINEIEMFLNEKGKIFETFRCDLCFQRAIQMNIAIIGEATNRILKEYPDIKISNARQIVNTRNYIIHGYDSLSLEMLWAIVVKDLPKLKNEVYILINQ